jgi:hypothetical protein
MWKAFKNANSEVKAAIIGGVFIILAAVIGGTIQGVFLLRSTSSNHSTPPVNAADAAVVSTMTAQAYATATASQCQFGTLQSQTAIQTTVEYVPDGSALVVTLPTVSDAQTVVLFANHSNLDAYVSLHNLAKIGATHTGPELLVLHEEKGRSSFDLILYQGCPTIEVVPNTQTASEISNFKQRYSNVCVNDPNECVREYTNHQQSTPDQQSIP